MRYLILLLLAAPLVLAGVAACNDDGEYDSGCTSGENAAEDYFSENDDDTNAIEMACVGLVDERTACPDSDFAASQGTTWDYAYVECCQLRRDYICFNAHGHEYPDDVAR